MNCPIDGSELRMTEREGVEIDYCPKCRGIWLDRGELDKILDKASDLPPVRPDEGRDERETERRTYEPRQHGHQKPYKRESIWSRIFDFD